MARTEIPLPVGATALLTRDEHGPQKIYDLLPTARTAFIVTYNLSKTGGSLLNALESATQLEKLRLITNIPNWWGTYYGTGARQRAREAIQGAVRALDGLAQRPGVEIYFTRKNHAKIYAADGVAYVGSSNFSDESAKNVEAGVLIQDEVTVEKLQNAAWELLKVDAQFHPTLGQAVAKSLEDWLLDELKFEHIYTSANRADPERAQAELRKAIEGLQELATRAEGILDDVRDEVWADPLQDVIREAATLDEIGQVVGDIDYSYGKIQACIKFSFEAAVNRYVSENCSDEETLDWWEAKGHQAAEEEWAELRTDALRDLRRVVEVLEHVKERVVASLQQLGRPVDNTKV